ncbi:hypothetical protein D3C78_904700 [compost metagenome]
MVLGQEHGGQRRQFGHAVALGETGGGEHAAGAIEQRRGDRRGTIADALQRADVELLQLRVSLAHIEQHLNHGRRQQHFVDALAGEDLQHLLRHESRLHDVGATAHEQRSHGREVGQVEHRHHVQVVAAGMGTTAIQHAQRRVCDVVVAEHHALGKTGGATGVEDAQQRVTAAARVFHRLAVGDQCLVAEHAFRYLAVAGIDHRANGLRAGGGAGTQFLEGVVDDQHAGVRIVEGIDDLRGAPADVHRVQHRIRPRHGLVVLDVALRVERQHRHAVTAGHAQLLQGTGQACDAVAELGVGHAAALIADGGRIRAPLQMAMQTLGDVHQNLQNCCCSRADRCCRPPAWCRFIIGCPDAPDTGSQQGDVLRPISTRRQG